LTPETFSKLLAWLDPELNRAGEKYEALRRRLITFFECHGSRAPQEHADETINRVARRIAAGEQVRALDPYTYIHGFARLVMKEAWRRMERADEIIAELSDSHHPLASAEADGDPQQSAVLAEQRFECMQHCLRSLPTESRELLVAYHQGAGRQRIDNRNLLASQLGISLNTLRIRVHRLRQQLEACADKCLQTRINVLKRNESSNTSE